MAWINDADNVASSYPRFGAAFTQLGVTIQTG